MDLPDQVSHRLSGYEAHHVEDGKLHRGQGNSDTDAAKAVIEGELKGLIQQLIQAPSILPHKYILHAI